MSRPATPAFTIIELVIVIAVLTLLLVLGLPSLARAREGARSVACLANLRSLGSAVQHYRDQHKEVFPLAFSPADIRRGRLAPFDTLATFLDAPLPVLDGTTVTSGDPWRCRSDGTTAPITGFSYAYFPLDLMGTMLGRPPEEILVRMRGLIEQSPQMPLLGDAQPVHDPRAPHAMAGRNVLRLDLSVGRGETPKP